MVTGHLAGQHEDVLVEVAELERTKWARFACLQRDSLGRDGEPFADRGHFVVAGRKVAQGERTLAVSAECAEPPTTRAAL